MSLGKMLSGNLKHAFLLHDLTQVYV